MGSRKRRRYRRGQPDEARKRVGPAASGGVKRIGCPCSRTALPLRCLHRSWAHGGGGDAAHGEEMQPARR
ncbi:hypothetical protein C2845_PM08G14380 [Panicum miliaceum]|uniref:Uncharacterized protein n=1 Tax=Panicum miliaceum TaxID=4540 RepID=A0A3L6QZT0_PANMI|nr:hypothetical protein C2845_PM08G14380 [Panicum miliaceum]